MKTQIWTALVILGLAFQLSACSSSGVKEDQAAGETPLSGGDAGTDAVPVEAPEGEQAPSTPMAFSVATTDYTVQAGDTLMKIAFDNFGDLYQWKSILAGNKDQISDPNALKTGMILKLDTPSVQVAVDRNGEKYLIKNGDTLGKISKAVYGNPSKWKEIWQNNKQLIHDPNKIFSGFYLYYLADGSVNGLAAAPTASSLDQAAGQLAPVAASPVPDAPVADLNSAAAVPSAVPAESAPATTGAE